AAYEANPGLANLLLNANVAKLLQSKKQALRTVIMNATQAGYPISGLAASLGYFDAYRNEKMPTNLIQAQRDYFGAHTYQRVDMAGVFHTEWEV
ncbi:MAG TPA: hypothetical protein VMI35_05475, partial [Puia sp.]|nr:hypothetical protein [Puia sp.]